MLTRENINTSTETETNKVKGTQKSDQIAQGTLHDMSKLTHTTTSITNINPLYIITQSSLQKLPL